MYHSIKSNEDIQYFLKKVNSLHDGLILGVQYINNGISQTENGHFISSEQSKLIIKILVTSICDAVVELEFENILEWQVKDNHWDIIYTTVVFDDQNWIIWTDDGYSNTEEMKKCSYVIAKSMRWRITEEQLTS